MGNHAGELVFVGLGSNMAKPAEQVMRAVDQLATESGIEVQRCSSLYCSPPWGVTDQADFVNAVVQISTSLNPINLLCALARIEQKMGRDRSGRRWGPRVIDLDLLAFGERIISTDSLIVPHPRIVERAFVLLPFAEIAPHYQLPGLGGVKQLLTLRDDAGTIRRL